MASQMDEPFCFDSDVDNSLQLVFPSRTVDLVAKDEEEATLLARGFQVKVVGILRVTRTAYNHLGLRYPPLPLPTKDIEIFLIFWGCTTDKSWAVHGSEMIR